MKLYVNLLSPNSRKVDAFAKHLGVSLEIVSLDFQTGAHKKPEFLAINPNGLLPALVDGDTKLWESNAILAYLAAKQDTSAWPKDQSRYQIMKWMSWESCHFAPPVSKLIGQFVFAPMRGQQPDQLVVDKALAEFRKYAAVANGQLETTKYLVGKDPTIADFAVAVWLGYEEKCHIPLSEYPHLQRWWRDMQALAGGERLAPPRK